MDLPRKSGRVIERHSRPSVTALRAPPDFCDPRWSAVASGCTRPRNSRKIARRASPACVNRASSPVRIRATRRNSRTSVFVIAAFRAHARQHAVRYQFGAVRFGRVLGGLNRSSQKNQPRKVYGATRRMDSEIDRERCALLGRTLPAQLNWLKFKFSGEQPRL